MSPDVVPVVDVVAHDYEAKQTGYFVLHGFEFPYASISLQCSPARLVEQPEQRFSVLERHSFVGRIDIVSEST